MPTSLTVITTNRIRNNWSDLEKEIIYILTVRGIVRVLKINSTISIGLFTIFVRLFNPIIIGLANSSIF